MSATLRPIVKPANAPQIDIGHLPEASNCVDARVLLEAKALHMHFGGQLVLNGTDITLRHGEIVLLRGENGSGKTTLLNILTGNLEPDSGVIQYLADATPRTYRFPRRFWEKLNPDDHFTPEFVAQAGVCRTWQDVRLFHALSLRDNVTVAVSSDGRESPIAALLSPSKVIQQHAEAVAQATLLLSQLGLAGREDSSADHISLGQSKRVAIARAVAAGARVLFLDEPLSGLDATGISDVVSLLEKLSTERGITLVIVEHLLNLPHLEKIANVDWLLDEGKISRSERASGGQKCHIESNVIQSRIGSTFNAFIQPHDFVVEDAMLCGARLTRVRSVPHAVLTEPPLLAVEGLAVARGRRLIDWTSAGTQYGLSLDLHRGDLLFLQAPNGWGKTTLIECIAGLIAATRGIIRLNSVVVNDSLPWERVRAGLSLIRADGNVFPNLTGREFLRLAGSSTAGLDGLDYLDRPIATYSGGQRQMLVVKASNLAEPAKIRIYDEPFSMLDKHALDRVLPLFRPDPDSAILVCLPLTAEIEKETQQ